MACNWHKNIAENFDRLSTAHELYRQTGRRQTDGRQHNSECEREFTFAKKTPQYNIPCEESKLFGTIRHLVLYVVWGVSQWACQLLL